METLIRRFQDLGVRGGQRPQRPRGIGWLAVLAAVLGLLLIVGLFWGRGGPAPEAPAASSSSDADGLVWPAAATEEPGETPVDDRAIAAPRVPAIGDAVGFLAKFGLVLVLLYGSLRVLRRFMLNQQGIASSAHIEVLETKYLSSNRALYLVGAGPKVLLLGGTDQQITVLAEMTDGEWNGENGAGEMEDGGRRGRGAGPNSAFSRRESPSAGPAQAGLTEAGGAVRRPAPAVSRESGLSGEDEGGKTEYGT
ncbi:MAG: hypothetical protein MAG451_03061 [Anaerolineales bacterium]|nr:hypothetical protein [Anaerolineales bacterium]